MLIRPATLQDAEQIADIYAFFVNESAISFETQPPPSKEIAQRIRQNSKAFGFLVAQEADGAQVLGYAYGSQFRARSAYAHTVETSVYIAPQAQGRGIGRALYTQLLSDLAARGFHTAIAVITGPNPNSEKLHRACGFTRVGELADVGYKFGRWHPTLLYQRIL